MKLIQLFEEHYIEVDDSEIKIGDIVVEKLLTGKYELFTIHTLNDINRQTQKKVIRSTQPLELICCTPAGQIKTYIDCEGCDRGTLGYNEVNPLSLSEVKELIGVVDVEKKAQIEWGNVHRTGVLGYIDGYNQALEDNKEKTYTKEDLEKAIEIAQTTSYVSTQLFSGHSSVKHNFKPEEIIQSLKPKTEWEVETIDGKLKLKS